jgi:hypothetical protein
VRNGILEHNWESTNGQVKVAKIVLPQNKVNNALTKLHGGPSGGHLDIDKTLSKVQQQYYWL